MMNKKPTKYQIETVLDFAKIPPGKLPECLIDFTEWVKEMRRAKKIANILTPIDKFVWIDDKRHDITVTIVAAAKTDKEVSE
jgi:hypothetical protein